MRPGNYILRTTRHALRITFFALTMLLIQTAPLHAASMNDYCQVPSYVTTGASPNLLLMIDNSASQYDLAYVNVGTYCYDQSYNNTSTYVGYFDTAANYQYNTSDVSLTNAGKFISGATMPSSCTYGGSSSATPYVCVNMSGTAPSRTVTQFIASGKFLNWLSASKLDVQKKILTGGKYDITNSILTGQSRGCDGSRFIKVVPAISAITFVERGPNSFEADYVNPSTQGGNTRIEIYDGTYNSTDCQAAVNDWVTGANLGQTQTDTRNCIGSGAGLIGAQIAEYNHIIHNCYWYYEGHAMSNDNTLQNECADIYSTYYSNNPASITNDTAGDAVCSSSLSHPVFTGITQTGYIQNDMGYLGRCACYRKITGQYKWYWDADCSDSNTAANVTLVAPCALDGTCNDCSQNEQIDFCQGITANPVTDPSSPTITGTTMNVPAFVMDAGVSGKFRSGTFYAKVSLSPAPTGIIDEFKNLINFGAMTFNYDASGAECGVSGSGISCVKNCSVTTTKQCFLNSDCPGETCVTSTKTDGAKIISYINSDPVGDHTTGLIKAIDDIQATSWTPFAEGFYNAIGYFAKTDAYTTPPTLGTSRTDLKLNTSLGNAYSYDESKNPSQYVCQDNDILLITDGMSTADQAPSAADALAAVYSSNYPSPYAGVSGYDTTNSCPQFAGSRSAAGLAWIAQNRNIKTFSKSAASTTSPSATSEQINTYVVYSGSLTSSKPGLCDPYTFENTTAQWGGTGSAITASDPSQLEAAIRSAFLAAIRRASSGTAASVLASGSGEGANLVQALFYPRSPTLIKGGIFNNERAWFGRLQDLWYFVDPFFANSNIREDTNTDKILNLSSDYITQTYFDTTSQTTKAHRYNDNNSDGGSSTTLITPDPISLEQISNLWEAGVMLWWRTVNPSNPGDTNNRNLYTYCVSGTTCLSGTNPLTSFSTTNAASLQSYLQAGTSSEAQAIIRYINGEDNPVVSGTTYNYRPRTVSVDLDNSGTISASPTVTINGVTMTETPDKVWKLGDIVNSTPRISSQVQLSNYDTKYNDASYTAYLNSSAYTNRGMVFAGANDGMLHAFKLGKLEFSWSGQTSTQKARITNPSGFLGGSGVPIGTEMWAFIPKNVLPYLKYIADPGYCHVYSIDLSPYVFDASIGAPGSGDISANTKPSDGSTWRTILIGGMRNGGACRNNGTACNSKSCSVTTGTSCTTNSDCPTNETCLSNCVNTPTDGNGYSSYFALDVTDQSNPTLLWEFSNSNLGFTTTGPAVVREGPGDKNGKWFVVFGSGPTGPVDTSKMQFLGRSDQNLKLFVLDLNAGSLQRTIDTTIPNAFAGSMINATTDLDLNYKDDIMYIGYVKEAFDGTWTDGGIGRLVTNESADPSNWAWSPVKDGIGPVTTAIATLQNTNKGILWLYFGTGRYFYKQGVTIDDPNGQRTLYGVQDPCFSTSGFNSTCNSAQTGALDDVTTTQITTEAANGWKIDLAASGSPTGLYAERVITDTLATTGGNVFFTTFQPYTNQCLYGGKSYIWATRYNTGGAPSSAQLQGIALLQVSTGSIERLTLSTAFTDAGGRKTAAIEGVPPTAQGLAVLSSPPPVKRTIHMRER